MKGPRFIPHPNEGIMLNLSIDYRFSRYYTKQTNISLLRVAAALRLLFLQYRYYSQLHVLCGSGTM
jgi:hypothetical protein